MDKRRGDKKSDTRLLVFNKTWLSSIKRVCWQSRRKSEHWLNQRFKQGQFNCLVMEIHIRDSVIFLLRWSIVIAICASSWLASLHLNTYVCFFTWCGIKLSTGWLGACLWGGVLFRDGCATLASSFCSLFYMTQKQDSRGRLMLRDKH